MTSPRTNSATLTGTAPYRAVVPGNAVLATIGHCNDYIANQETTGACPLAAIRVIRLSRVKSPASDG